MKRVVIVIGICLATTALYARPHYRPTMDRAEIEAKAFALFDMVYACAKSEASKEACRAQLATALRKVNL